MFLIFLAGDRDRNYVEVATSSKPTIGTGGQHDAIALAPASNMTATDLDVSEIAVPRHRYQRLAHSPTLKIHGCHLPSIDRERGKTHTRNFNDGIDLGQSTRTLYRPGRRETAF